ncbi:hypothetical protein D9M70_652340 [compost metagenome]
MAASFALPAVAGAPLGRWPNMCGMHCRLNQLRLTGSPDRARLTSGTDCSPIRMPNKPMSAMTGGAGERTFKSE